MKINRQIVATLITASFLLQLIVITYNHLTGFNEVDSWVALLAGLAFGTFFTFLTAIILALLDIFIINLLNEKLPWDLRAAHRIISDVVLAAVPGAFIGILLTLFVNYINPYDEEITGVIISNALITSVVNIIMMISLEGYWFFTRERIWLKRASYLEQENNSIRYEVLKNQLNPHFLFNSLNVLSSLVNKDNMAAQEFIDEFALIYRYILESIDKKLVTVKEEIAFCKSFLYLQEVRFDKGFQFSININVETMDMMLPPLSIQLLLENVFKHNIVSAEAPVEISITNEPGFLIVKNSLKPKAKSDSRTGIGLKNLARRYAILSAGEPHFTISEDHYIAKIPIIEIL